MEYEFFYLNVYQFFKKNCWKCITKQWYVITIEISSWWFKINFTQKLSILVN